MLKEMFGRYCTNAFSIWNDALESIGIGIYLGAALLNHSCEPNCWTFFNGRTLQLRTLCKIAPGQVSSVTRSCRAAVAT
jgi:SET and MYND domain-containing protein